MVGLHLLMFNLRHHLVNVYDITPLGAHVILNIGDFLTIVPIFLKPPQVLIGVALV